MSSHVLEMMPRSLDEARTNRVRVGHANVNAYTFAEAVEAISSHAKGHLPPAYVVTPNAQHIVLLEKHQYLRQVYRKAKFVLADGMSLIWASSLLSPELPERVTGVDLFQGICQKAATEDLKIFLLGGRPGAADLAAERLKNQFPSLEIVGTVCPPLGFENDPVRVQKINRQIRESGADMLFVGLGAPKQEYWMYKNCAQIGVPISVGIGGTFDFIAGYTKRAPLWMQKSGLEWFHRLCSEPLRLFHRYVIGIPHFIYVVLRQKFSSSRSMRPIGVPND